MALPLTFTFMFVCRYRSGLFLSFCLDLSDFVVYALFLWLELSAA